MIQAFYTSLDLAIWMGQALRHRFKGLTLNALDLCAGTGRLSQGFQTGSHYSTHIRTTFIEPATLNRKALIASVGSKGCLFEMTAEEYNLTYAQTRQFDLTFCNPPFGNRCGQTQIGELVTNLHLPEIKRFESYFLLTASVLTKSHLVFILPNSYAKNPEAEDTFLALQAMGWNLREIVELPLDAFDDALVSTSLLIWSREPGQIQMDWAGAALETMKNPVESVYDLTPSRKEHRGHHGPVWGYLLDDQDFNFRACLPSFCSAQEAGPQQETFSWVPEPKPIGELWERMGCMYALTEEGWQPANTSGYAEGKPICAEFQIAKDAHLLMQQGAFESGQTLLQTINLPSLQSRYGQFSFGSFLNLLSQRPVGTQPVQTDLKTLGIIDLTHIRTPLPESSGEQLGPYRVAHKYLTLAQKCKLFLEGFLPQSEIKDLQGTQIPYRLLELRSPWIPRELVAEYLSISLHNGLFDANDDWSLSNLAAYLNYGKGDKRIKPGDIEAYSAACDKFAADMNDWGGIDHQTLRLKIHAHFHQAHEAKKAALSGLKPINPAKPLHFWQRDDIAFLLQGEAICNWDVGLGKTAGAMAVAASHPGTTLIAVPKPVLSKWQAEFKVFFPDLRVSVLGYRLNKAGKWVLNTKNLQNQAQTLFFQQTHQVILTTHQVFARLEIKEREQALADIQDSFDLVGHNESKSAATARAKFVKSAADRNFLHGGVFSFTDLPLSNMLLIVDEGHQFKSLFPMPSYGWGNALIMAGSCGTSKRARDMKIKTDLLREAGGKTLCLTATPVTNSVVEAFNMWRIWAPSILRKRGILNPQQFIDQFCSMEPLTAVSATGKIVSGTTIGGFRNLEALKNMWESCMITRTAEDVQLPLPQKFEHKIEIEPTRAMNQWMHEQKQNLETSIQKNAKEKVHIFSIISNLDTIAAHPPLVGISDNPKGNALSQKVWEFYTQTKGGQIIFSDRVESHEAIAQLLAKAGIPRSEIDILNASTAPNIDDRLAIQERFNTGTTRIVIGGVVASEGIDLQRNCVAIHFNNLTWESQSIHQRVGRGVRQGNQQAAVHVFYYLLKSSTDIYRFATTQNKKHWWDSLRCCQTDSTNEGLFSDPISDDLISSIALDPIATQTVLREARDAKEKETQSRRFAHLLKKMLNVLDPTQRTSSQPILEELEQSLRHLNQIPQELTDQGLQRAQLLASFIHEDRVNFSNWKEAVNAAGRHFEGYYFSTQQFFSVSLESTPQFERPISVLKRPKPLSPFPKTLNRAISKTLASGTPFHFEKPQITNANSTAQPTLQKPFKTQRTKPVIPEAKGVWVQLSLFT